MERYEEFGEIYDRFPYLIVCDLSGTAIKAVPYMCTKYYEK